MLAAYGPHMPKPTAHQRLADLLLQRPVADFIREQRANEATWAVVADRLRDATDGAVDVTAEAVRQWHRQSEAGAA